MQKMFWNMFFQTQTSSKSFYLSTDRRKEQNYLVCNHIQKRKTADKLKSCNQRKYDLKKTIVGFKSHHQSHTQTICVLTYSVAYSRGCAERKVSINNDIIEKLWQAHKLKHWLKIKPEPVFQPFGLYQNRHLIGESRHVSDVSELMSVLLKQHFSSKLLTWLSKQPFKSNRGEIIQFMSINELSTGDFLKIRGRKKKRKEYSNIDLQMCLCRCRVVSLFSFLCQTLLYVISFKICANWLSV